MKIFRKKNREELDTTIIHVAPEDLIQLVTGRMEKINYQTKNSHIVICVGQSMCQKKFWHYLGEHYNWMRIHYKELIG